MKKFLIAFSAALALALISSCDLSVDQVYIGSEYLIATEEGGSFPQTLYATGHWTASINTPEGMSISISPESGDGTTEVVVTIGTYESDADLSLGYIVLECGKAVTSFPVYQCTTEYWQEMEESRNSYHY